MKKRTLNGVLFFLFLFLILDFVPEVLASVATEPSKVSEAARDPVWHALLHLRDGRPQISDPKFYIQEKFEGPEQELLATLSADSICRFPARYFWLEEKLGLAAFDFSKCTELLEFRERAPLESSSLIFASEKVSLPSTMMGHVFLKLSGKNRKDVNVDHAISFFTDLNDGNFTKLVFESLLVGKKGFYTLSPYEVVKNNYLLSEERNIWDYELALSERQKRRLHFHLFELKNVSFKYFFIQFNCATLIQNVLAIVFPDIQAGRGMWVTPMDVVRAIDRSDYVAATKVIPASRWKVKVLKEALSSSADFSTNSSSDSPSRDYLSLELAEAYAGYRFEQDEISIEQWRTQTVDFKLRREKLLNGGFVDLANYKRPSLARKDSQIAAAFFVGQNEQSLRFRFLPASHGLEDDTRQYTSESELKIGDVEAEYLLHEKRMRISSAMLYSAASFQPTDDWISSLSGRFRLGYEALREINLSREPSPNLEGALGQTYRFFQDIDAYWLLGVGARAPSRFYFYGGPEIGVVVREVWAMKSILSYRQVFFGRGSLAEGGNEAEAFARSVSEFKLTHTLNFDDFALIVSFMIYDNQRKTEQSGELSIKRYF